MILILECLIICFIIVSAPLHIVSIEKVFPFFFIYLLFSLAYLSPSIQSSLFYDCDRFIFIILW